MDGAVIVGIFLAVGVGLYAVARAIFRRMFQPKTATLVAIASCGLLLLLGGEFMPAVGIAVACGVLDLLTSTRPV